jgi:type II secretory pathway component GspD/PulD (secretin)
MAMVWLEVLVGDVPIKAAKTAASEGKLGPEEIRRQMEVLIRAELTAVENQPAFVQVGRREARITGTSFISSSATVNSVTFENVGTMLGFTSRVAAGGIAIVQLDIQDSRLGPAEEGTPITIPSKGEPIRTPHSEMFSTQTTLRIPDGQTVVAGGMAREAKAGKQRLVLVTARVLGKTEPAESGRR